MRKKLALIAVLTLVVLAGCAGLTTYEAPPAETDDDLAQEYNYEITEQDEMAFEDNVTLAGHTQEIKMSGWFTLYEKDISHELNIENDTQSPIVYGTINTPSVSVSDNELNPLIHQPAGDIMGYVSEETDGIDIGDKVDEINVTHQYTNETINVSKHEATFRVEELGVTFDGYVLASIIELDDSIALVFGGHPEAYNEEDNILELMKSTTSVESNAE